MCGIFALLNFKTNEETLKNINNEFMKGLGRGPEFSKLDTSFENTILGFHRLAINGLNEESNQPLIIDGIALICNGEIYNYGMLYDEIKIIPKTGSDCEVIIYLYLKYGIEQTLNMLDGVFAFVLYDTNNQQMYVARDPLGVRPLYVYEYDSYSKDELEFGFASELKCLEYFYNSGEGFALKEISQFKPGTYTVLKRNFGYDNGGWKLNAENIPYYIPSISSSLMCETFNDQRNYIWSNICRHLRWSVNKRCITTERPIACLLSGGLDSSLIASLVNDFYNINNLPNDLETYSIGLKDSEDLKYAKTVAEYLDTKHTEIIVTEQLMFDTIPKVIKAIESYDTTTVRASIGNYLLGKFIAKNSTAKVIFNGDGADELFGGYLYMDKCPDSIEFDKETRRLLKDIHLFDVLRSDKCISSHGLEPRTPFLDRSFVNFILSIPPKFRNLRNCEKYDKTPHEHAGIEKFMLRYSFSQEITFNYCHKQQLPDAILWRKKEAFSDGVSSKAKGRSLYQILQEKIAAKMTSDTGILYEANIETEKLYYRQIFDNFYPNCHHLVPYYWMPKYTDATDPSARTLDIYEINK